MPHIRGVTMNRSTIPWRRRGPHLGRRHPVTPWGFPTKGQRKNRKNKSTTKLIISGRHASEDRRENRSEDGSVGTFDLEGPVRRRGYLLNEGGSSAFRSRRHRR